MPLSIEHACCARHLRYHLQGCAVGLNLQEILVPSMARWSIRPGPSFPRLHVEIRNPVSGFDRSTITDSSGKFEFTNVPFNNYHLTVTAPGFAAYAQDVEPRSSVPVKVAIKLQVGE